jgi:hypothetical protein
MITHQLQVRDHELLRFSFNIFMCFKRREEAKVINRFFLETQKIFRFITFRGSEKARERVDGQADNARCVNNSVYKYSFFISLGFLLGLCTLFLCDEAIVQMNRIGDFWKIKICTERFISLLIKRIFLIKMQWGNVFVGN